MFCPNCGNQLPDGSNFCGSCGMNLSSAETKSFSEQSVNDVSSGSEKAGVGICIVSFIFPIVGIILYAVNKKKKLEYAKTVGRWAVIGMIVGLAFTAIISAVGGDDSSGSSQSPSSQYDFGLSETPTVGIRENVETMVFEVESAGFLSSRVTISHENDVIIAVKGYYNILDLTHTGADISKNAIDVVYEQVRTSDSYNITMNVEPGYNTLDCDFSFTSLDGSNARESNRILATLFGFRTNNSDVLYMSSVKEEMIAFGYELVDSY